MKNSRQTQQSFAETKFWLGVLIDRKDSCWHIGRRSNFLYRELWRMGKQYQVQVYFFFSSEVDWAQGQVQGYIPQKNGWRKDTFPLAPVIYNRIVEREWENRAGNQKFLQRVAEQKNIVLFNQRFLNKAEVAAALFSSGTLQDCLPVSLAGSPENVRLLLQQQSGVYIKPIAGCKGQGIVVLHPLQEQRWQVQWAIRAEKQVVEGIEELLPLLEQWNVDWANCIVQEEVKRLHYQGCPFDVRVLVQKDGKDRWRYVGAAVRIAAVGREATHLVNGGRRLQLRLLWQKFPERMAIHLKSELRRISVAAAEILEQQLALSLGILAMDIALDATGAWKLLEVNARPGSFSEGNLRRRSLQYLMQYCCSLQQRRNEE